MAVKYLAVGGMSVLWLDWERLESKTILLHYNNGELRLKDRYSSLALWPPYSISRYGKLLSEKEFVLEVM